MITKPEEKEAEATAEVFMTAFRALPEQSREKFLEYLAKDREIFEDFMDVAVVESRRDEPSVSLETALKEIE